MANHIDKRDGFPKNFLTATHVAVAEPIQYHLRPEDQRVVGILAEEIITTKDIGTSFEKLPYEFTLDNDVKVHIYRKVRPFKEGDLRDLESLFFSYYPDKRDVFTIRER